MVRPLLVHYWYPGKTLEWRPWTTLKVRQGQKRSQVFVASRPNLYIEQFLYVSAKSMFI